MRQRDDFRISTGAVEIIVSRAGEFRELQVKSGANQIAALLAKEQRTALGILLLETDGLIAPRLRAIQGGNT